MGTSVQEIDSAIDKGLEGIVACTTKVSSIIDATLTYRGYTIEDLAAKATFEEVVFLLWNGRLPKQDELAELTAQFRANYSVPSEVIAAMKEFPSLGLHSSPDRFIEVLDEPSRPQPRLDRDRGNGMTVTVGRIFPDNVFDYRFVALSHNTVRGAAGSTILNAELLASKNLI